MKFKIQDEKDAGKEYTFLRTLGTEKKFKDSTDQEFNAQLGGVLKTLASMQDMEHASAEDYAQLASLQFSEVRDLLVEFMFAEKNSDGELYQNSETRQKCAELISNGHIKPITVITVLMKSIF